MNLTFKAPTMTDKAAVLAFRQAYLTHYDENAIHGGSELDRFGDDDFDKWLDYIYAPAGTNWFDYDKVAADTLVIYLGDVVVGIVNVRYELTDFLRQVGGHVGYSTHPAYQGQGIASSATAHACTLLKNHGVDRALITCRDDNAASAKVIENNGGILENKITLNDKIVRRYWITLVG